MATPKRANEANGTPDRLALIESRLAESQEISHTGSWEWTIANDSEWWSEELYRICGFRPNSIRPDFDVFIRLIHAGDVEVVSHAIQKAFEDHQPFELEHRIVRSDGEVRTLHIRCRVIVDDHGKVARMVGTAQDITERKASEQAVQRSERRLRTIFDAEPACVKLVSAEGRLLDMNPAGLKMIGAVHLSQVAGRAIVDLVHPADRSRYVDMHRAASGGSSVRSEFRIIGFNGEQRWVDSHSVPFETSSDRDATACAVLSVTSDVTERKHLEEQLWHAQKMDAIGRLAGGIAHDFNNIVMAIMGHGDLALRGLKRGHRLRHLEEIRRSAERAATLTRQLLAFSHRQVLTPRLLNVNTLVANVEGMVRGLVDQNITLVTTLDENVSPVRADPSQLEQMLVNLVLNAKDALPRGGTISIETANVECDARTACVRDGVQPGQYVMIKVSDTGIGMDVHTRSRIFEPFFTTKERGKGTGLGLSTVYGIVRQSGGHISVDSEPGEGSVFKVYLPNASGDAAVEPAEPLRLPRPRGSETILIAEDDHSVRTVIAETLQAQGYAVLEAPSGEDAVALAAAAPTPIHLLITDLMLPGINGRTLAERLTQRRRALKVLYISAYTDRTIIRKKLLSRKGIVSGRQVFLQKPFSPDVLAHTVRHVLDARDQASSVIKA